jgi:hypothetical protein
MHTKKYCIEKRKYDKFIKKSHNPKLSLKKPNYPIFGSLGIKIKNPTSGNT